MQLELRGTFPDLVVDAIRLFISGQGTLHDVVARGLASRPTRDVVDVVIQDEFTHDSVVRWSDEVFLVYDTS